MNTSHDRRTSEDPIRLIFMGPCGCGKSTLATRLAEHLGCGPIIEGDSYHSPEMKAKMGSGIPLTDEDRWPWLDRLNQALRESKSPVTLLSCSALRRVYRERLTEGLGDSVSFIFLDAPQAVIAERLAKRSHEYMPVSLLESQYRTLERPDADEPVFTVSVAESEDEAFEAIKTILTQLRVLSPVED